MRSKEDRAEALQQYAMSNDAFDWDDADEPSSEYLGSGAVPYTTKAVVENGDSSQELMKYGSDFHHAVMMASQGREVQVIQLFKPEGGGLGFSVVGLKSENRGELGIFVQDIQPTGVASHDGRLQESDQILAIDGQPLDASISHQQAIGILQQAQGLVELVVARGGIPNIAPIVRSATPSLDRTPSAVSSVSQQSGVITAEHPFIQWGHVEEIVLHNDGTGLGFGIIGGKSAGVVVKTILPGGVASRDGRLRSGDHILKIGDTSLAGMNSENVATVLRQSGSTVTLTVARNPMLEQPSSLSSNQQQSIPVVAAAKSSTPVPQQDEDYNLHRQQEQTTDLDVEVFEVELVKDSMGLGITIAGYVGQGISGDVSGIFVKSVAKDSTADRSGKVKVHDQIIEVDGTSLDGYDNKEAVDVLRHTGTVVKLKLARYNAGSIVQPSPVEQPPQPSPPPPPPSSESQYETFPPVYQDTDIVAVASSFTDEEPQGPPAAYLVAGSDDSDEDDMLAGYLPPSSVFVAPQQQNQQPPPPPYVEVNNAAYMDDDYTSDLSPQAEEAIKAHWMNILGPDAEVEVAQISKFHQGGGLGISLEGTVDIEDGEEVRPHHYIRSILPDGPVGQNGKLKSGDELLEVNGTQLLGLHHVDVIGILKELPMCVRIVVGRHGHPLFPDRGLTAESQKIENSPMLAQLTASEPNLFGVQSGGGDASEGLAKAHSESTLLVQDEKPARILDTSSGLAMWSDAPTEIILIKADRGLGFSILDYQDPMNPEETVIVIRSLVPGGVADQDSRLIPGDRLVYVNDTHLDNCTLEKAVQALKGAPQGPVRIGVAKPLALSESAHRDEVSSSIKELQMQEISLDQLEDDEIKQIQDSSSSSSSSSKSEEDNELERLEAARKEAMAAMNLFAVTTGKEEPQRPPSPKMDEKHDDEERIETVRREAMQAMNQYAVTTGKDPTPQTEAPHFRAPPPLFDSSSEDLDVDDVEVKREKTKSDEEKEKIETVRREAMAAMNMYATTTGQKAAEQPVEKLKTPSPPPEPQSFTPIPPPRPQQSDEQKERLEAARREAMMAMNSYAMETGQKTQEIRPVSPKLEPKQLHVRQPSPEPEPVEDNTEEEKRLEAMRVEEVMALNAFAIASVQEPQEMEIVAATPVMIEVKRNQPEPVEFREYKEQSPHVESVPAQVAQETYEVASSHSSTSYSESESESDDEELDERIEQVSVKAFEESVVRETVEIVSQSSSSSEVDDEVQVSIVVATHTPVPDIIDDVYQVHADEDSVHDHIITNGVHDSSEVSSVSSGTSHTSYSESDGELQVEAMHASLSSDDAETPMHALEQPFSHDVAIHSVSPVDNLHAEGDYESPDEHLYSHPDHLTYPSIQSDSDEEVEFPPLPAGPPPPLPFQPPPTEEEEEIVPYFSESQSDASMTPSFAVAALDMQDDGSTGSSPMSSPGMLDRKAVVVLPCILEKTVRLNKGNAGLGFMTAAEKGNGVIVKSITRGGIVDIDGRIKVGDYITAVNSESMRDLTNSQARSLLRRCSLIGTDIR
uniref:Multiple PDZ domain protein-like n=1 Tax=Saccoglossus kowalevskii TaxID=10224 RepID=A0ABM0MQ85_SACKO|nr:PREDICTED: multiple PDZ domain protein-like [Saccoglossus kowalevskii]